MVKRMLVDATHEEETRVAVVDGKRLEEFDYESTYRKPLKGSIFLAKVTRVEPSLQAAFVNYGGNRHGFLPFSEIHPDYFRIPIADREALIAEQEAAMEEAARKAEEAENEESEEDDIEESAAEEDADNEEVEESGEPESDKDEDDVNGNVVDSDEDDVDGNKVEASAQEDGNKKDDNRRGGQGRRGGRGGRGGRGPRRSHHRSRRSEKFEDMSEEERFRYSLRRKYKIQEVIKRGQIMLIQVSKEERGNKGAAVTSYLSLPGRYCVLMPNSPRAGGVSRKIANYKDRKTMKDILTSLEIPKGMSVIVRTAGVSRTKTEIKRDYDYLSRLWSNIREDTLSSSAPALIYEEANLIKRAVRDIYTREIDDIIVAGEEGHKTAKQFMKMMIPSHVKKVQLYDDKKAPIFQHYQVENQIAEIGEVSVALKSGGYLVINPTEALVSVDVNSGKATKERHIEETALKTNLEAAEEVARQLRLRDLGGLVVIDFIDMEDRRNNGKVERKMRDALSGDRARVQVGRISNFGLMELSRQRLNPSLTEAQFETCPHCKGTGTIRTADGTSVMVIRAIEEEAVKKKAASLIVHVSDAVAIYILNNKRRHISEIEAKYGVSVSIRVDEEIAASDYRIDVNKQQASDDGEEEDSDEDASEKNEEKKSGGRRRGRRGGRNRGRRNDKNEQKDEAAEENAESSDKDSAEEKPKRGGRKPKSAENVTKKDNSAEEKSEDKPQKKAGDKKAADKAQDKNKKDAANDEPAKAKPKAKAKKAAPKKKEEKPAADYETVNEPPKAKKSGWWNKLTD